MNVEKYRYDYAGSRMAKIGNLSTFPCRYEPYQYLISPSAFIEQGEIFYKKFTNNIYVYILIGYLNYSVLSAKDVE